MKSLIDKIVDILEQRSKDSFNDDKKRTLNNAILTIKRLEEKAEFEEVARVMMKHLGQGEKYHPHHTVIITNTNAELVEGQRSTGNVEDYIPD